MKSARIDTCISICFCSPCASRCCQPHRSTHPTTPKTKPDVKKRASGKSKNRPKGVERRPLINKSEFTEECLSDLARHHFDPPHQRFIPDGRWMCETFNNGARVKWTRFLVSFD